MSPYQQDPIPTVDLSPFASGGTLEKRVEASQKLCDVCTVLGFVNVVGHGVSEALIEETFVWSKRLFNLTYEEKIKAPHPAAAIPHRGYSAPGIEKVYSKEDLDRSEAKGENGTFVRRIQDFRESYEVGSDHNLAQSNIWLPEEVLPGYRKFMTELYLELHKAAQRVLEAMCLGLGLAEEERDRMFKLHSGQNNQLRLLHYPQVEVEKLEHQVVGRMQAHQDWSSFTMVFQDACGGLELEDPRSRTFIPAKPIHNAAILNVGDMLQRYTNGIFPSAMHRVTLPTTVESTKLEDSTNRITRARYSVPYFVAPDHEGLVECLPTCVTANRPSRYEPVRWCDYGDYMSKYAYKGQKD